MLETLSGTGDHEFMSLFFPSISKFYVLTKAPHMCAYVVKAHMTWAQHRLH